MRVCFLDISCPAPYSPEVLETQALGGTEATVIRVAEGLAHRGHTVSVLQHNRVSGESFGASYLPFLEVPEADAYVGLRSTQLIPFLKKQGGKKILWLHDFNHQDLVRDYPLLENSGFRVLTVSRTHKQVTIDALLSQVGFVRGLTVGSIYNPVLSDKRRETFNPEQLVFFSSPHKGLDLTLKQFQAVRRSLPNMQLLVANPGYYDNKETLLPGVVSLGKLPHREILKHVSESLCVFHCNAVFPETFGLVHAEANAMGVPVLTGILGANHEILNPASEQMVEVRDEKTVVDRLVKWRTSPPQVFGKPDFQLESVVSDWEKELGA